MADAELLVDEGELVGDLVRSAGDDEIGVDQLLVAHRGQWPWPGLERELLAGAGAHADRLEPLDGAAQGRTHAPDEVTAGLEGLRPRVGSDRADQEPEVV